MIILHLCLRSFIIMNTCYYNCGEQATSLHAVTAYLVDKRVDCISGKTVWSLVHTCHTWTTWGWVIRGNALYKSTVTLRRFYDSAHRSLLLFRTESVLKRRRHQTPGGSHAPVPYAWRRHCLYCPVITDGVVFRLLFCVFCSMTKSWRSCNASCQMPKYLPANSWQPIRRSSAWLLCCAI